MGVIGGCFALTLGRSVGAPVVANVASCFFLDLFRTLLRCSARRERVACLGCLTRGLPHSYAIGSTCWWGDRGWGNPSVLTASPLSFSSPPPPPPPPRPPPRRFRIDFPVS